MMGYVSRGISYSSFFAVSVVSFVLPSPSLESVGLGTFLLLPGLTAFLPYIWSIIMAIGAISCLIGVLTRTWVGEFIGIGPIILAILALASAQLFFGILPNGFLLIGLSAILMYRWHIVRLEKAHAVVRSRHRHGWQSWYQTQDK